MRLQLLTKIASFGASIEDLNIVYVKFVRSILEQSSVVWHSSLTDENRQDLARIQRSAVSIIMGERFKNYSNSLKYLELEDLNSRRERLCLNFALRSMKHERFKHIFQPENIEHNMTTRSNNKVKIQFASKERLKRSAIPQMQRSINNHFKKNNK